MSRQRRFKGKPFGQGAAESTGSDVSDQLLKNARKSGKLNLSGRGLNEVPEKVWRLNLDAAAESREASNFDTEERWWDQEPLSKLILASNKLQTLSSNISLLNALKVLDVHDNQLEALPESIGELIQLQKIDVSHNKLVELPASLFLCTQLVSLHLAHNSLTVISEHIASLTELDDLNISHNKLSKLPLTIGKLTKLKTLDVSHNCLNTLPAEVQSLKGLKSLDVTHNQISTLPLELGYMRGLEQLYLRHNKLTVIPLLEHCSKLKELHLGNNLLKSFESDQLKCLTGLSVLDVRDNKIAVVPDNITELCALERLDITNNAVSALPYELGNMTTLTSLVVDGNPMRAIRRDIIARGSEGIKKYLRSRIEVEEPKAQSAVQSSSGQSGIFGDGDQLNAHSVKQSRSLDYSGKKADCVPDDVWELGVSAQATDVNFGKNALTQWPSNLVSLADWAISINLGFNKITTIPGDIGRFLQLKNLDLRNNIISTLPAEMESLQNLHTLILSVNRFQEIPDVLYRLSSLETLLISGNQVAQLNVPSLMRLTKLSSLDLQNNNLSMIPAELGNCTSLRSLLLGGNPCRNPRPAILNKGTDALMEYLRGRIVQ